MCCPAALVHYRRKGVGQGLERFRRPLRGQRQTQHFLAASAQCYRIAEAESEGDSARKCLTFLLSFDQSLSSEIK